MAVEARVFQMSFRVLTVICEEFFLHQAHRRQKLYSVFFASINFYVISLRDYKMRIIGFAWDSSCLFPSFAFASQNLGSQLKRKRPILEF